MKTYFVRLGGLFFCYFFGCSFGFAWDYEGHRLVNHLALASLPNFKLPGDLSASDRYWAEDIVDPPFELAEGGTVAVPYRWGLGVRVKMDMVDRLTVRREVIS